MCLSTQLPCLSTTTGGPGTAYHKPAMSQLRHLLARANLLTHLLYPNLATCLFTCLLWPSNAMWRHEHMFTHLPCPSTATRQHRKPCWHASVSQRCHRACKHACLHACHINTVRWLVVSRLFTGLLYHNTITGNTSIPVCTRAMFHHSSASWCLHHACSCLAYPCAAAWQWGTPIHSPAMFQHPRLVVCVSAMS